MMRFRTIAAAMLATGLAGTGTAQQAGMGDNWRAVATQADQARIAGLQRAWDTGLREARRADPAGVRRLGVVANPVAALSRPHPTPGMYRCRTIKLGQKGSGTRGFIAYGWHRCHADLTPGGTLFMNKTTGSQRPGGSLYPYTSRKLAFVGTVALGDDNEWPRYGTSPDRDVVGVFERIGAGHYRLVVPQPVAESELDIIELRR